MTETRSLWTLKARWIFPADAPPLVGGTITFKGDKIIAVEPAGTRTADEDLGNVAILPGFVNAHTHLDLSDARGKIPPTPDFVSWLRKVIEHRQGQTAEQVAIAILAGLDDTLKSGTTLLGDISVNGKSWRALSSAKIRASVFFEILGVLKERAEAACLAIRNWLDKLTPSNSCRPAVSPHAPYSVSSWLILKSTSWDMPIAIHLAESSAELELLMLRQGPFVPFLTELGIRDLKPLANDSEHILRIANALVPVLFIHGNYLHPLPYFPANGSIVYCPRTHAAFGHPPHPFREFMKRGVRVVLGTDSLASNPDLDILAEARFVHARCPDLPGETLLRMITLDGAIALGWGDVTGSLTPGKSADLVVLPLPDRDEQDPYRLIFESDLAVDRVVFRGAWRS